MKKVILAAAIFLVTNVAIADRTISSDGDIDLDNESSTKEENDGVISTGSKKRRNTPNVTNIINYGFSPNNANYGLNQNTTSPSPSPSQINQNQTNQIPQVNPQMLHDGGYTLTIPHEQ